MHTNESKIDATTTHLNSVLKALNQTAGEVTQTVDHLATALQAKQDVLHVIKARLDALEHLTDKLRTDAEHARGDT